jgi:hypothetical protein
MKIIPKHLQLPEFRVSVPGRESGFYIRVPDEVAARSAFLRAFPHHQGELTIVRWKDPLKVRVALHRPSWGRM